ncbi:chp-1 [Tribonema minus]|uniref:Chp-1 n=1 Tax=Tribonema minus TaxID=303371 RepID=A0A836CMP5_9STRA|nr:chp-1 [Tribonema minus]
MSRKVYLHYEEGSDAELHTTLKLTLPRKWVAEGSPMQVLELFIESYNKKKPQTPLSAEACHLENSDGLALSAGDVIGDVMRDREDIRVRPGATKPGKSDVATAAAGGGAGGSAGAAADTDGLLRCRNYGCGARYAEADNHARACAHHTAPPVFHDTKKGWSCCAKRVYDWDEFQAIAGCATGPHSTVDPKVQIAPSPTAVAAAAADAAAAAAAGADASAAAAPAPVRSIEAYNAANPQAATAAGSVLKAAAAAPRCTRRADGTARCLNKGCKAQDFVVAENARDACTHHRLGPVFHDTGKYWACCPDRVKYEFDDFLAIPGCCRGYHQDGSGEFDNGDGGVGGGSGGGDGGGGGDGVKP